MYTALSVFLISHLSVFLRCEMKAFCPYLSVMPSVCLLLHDIVKTYVVVIML